MIKVDTYFTPYFPEKENQFKDQFLVMIDVLRASTTICSALHNGAKEIIPFAELQRAVSVYGNLSRETRFLGGERKGIKPEGFDAGNSPFEYVDELVKDKTIIFTTTNGTKIFTKGREASKRVVGCFANLSLVLKEINSYIELNKNKGLESKITFLCAGTNGRVSYEDMMCAGAFIEELKSKDLCDISESAHVANDLYLFHKSEIRNFLKTTSHAKYLIEIGKEDDVDLCFQLDKFPVVPLINESSITLLK
jgi:2-phosphosulfolactate phosphatase